MDREKAVKVLVQAYRNETMYGVVGYVNHISTTSHVEAEKLRNAAISLGGECSSWGQTEDNMYRFRVQFPMQIIVELEDLAFPTTPFDTE
jgi:hypothetical protein